jgi:hypothetical protein
MLSILVILPADGAAPALSAPNPSVEILVARGAEDALEKLGRNRRIDAILMAAGDENSRIEEAIREDEPAPPQIFSASPGVAIGADLAHIIESLES